MKKPERIKPIYHPLTQQEIQDTINQIEEQDNQNLARTLYLFGLRITEALQLKQRDITITGPPNKQIYIAKAITLKNKKDPFRQPIAWQIGTEGELLQELKEYLDQIKPSDALFNMSRQQAWHAFNKVKITIDATTHKPRKQITVTRGLWPHYLRHCRASHLANKYFFGHQELQNYFGWASPLTAGVYVRGSWEGLAKQGWKAITEED